MGMLLRVGRQTFWQILGKVVTASSTLITLAMVARNYGVGGTGIFTLTLTYLAMFYLLSDFGFNAHALKKIQAGEFRKLLGTRIIWSVFLIALAVGLLPFLPFNSADFALAIIIGSPAIVASAVFTTCNLIFQSKLRYDLSVIASSFGSLLSLLVLILLVNAKLNPPFLLLAHLSGWITIAVLGLILVKKLSEIIVPIFDKKYIKTIFGDSWPIAATLAVNVVYFRIDSFLITYFKGISEVGIYNIAYSVFQSGLVLPSFIMNAYYPLMIKSLSGIRFVAVALLAFSSIATVSVLVLAPFLIKLLTGGGFVGSTQSLQILSLGFPAFFISSLFMWLLIREGKYKKMLLIYIIGLAVNLILNFSFIPQYSYIGASWITVISEYLILSLQVVTLFVA